MTANPRPVKSCSAGTSHGPHAWVDPSTWTGGATVAVFDCPGTIQSGRDIEQTMLRNAVTQLVAVRELIDHARKISPSERAVVYVADLERALGIDAPTPHKLGGNG